MSPWFTGAPSPKRRLIAAYSFAAGADSMLDVRIQSSRVQALLKLNP
jgi:hypothetical protein